MNKATYKHSKHFSQTLRYIEERNGEPIIHFPYTLYHEYTNDRGPCRWTEEVYDVGTQNGIDPFSFATDCEVTYMTICRDDKHIDYRYLTTSDYTDICKEIVKTYNKSSTKDYHYEKKNIMNGCRKTGGIDVQYDFYMCFSNTTGKYEENTLRGSVDLKDLNSEENKVMVVYGVEDVPIESIRSRKEFVKKLAPKLERTIMEHIEYSIFLNQNPISVSDFIPKLEDIVKDEFTKAIKDKRLYVKNVIPKLNIVTNTFPKERIKAH